MNIVCPKCGYTTTQSEEELQKLNYIITCPSCMSMLKIVNGIAYIPSEKANIDDLAPIDTQQPPEFKGESYYERGGAPISNHDLYYAAVEYVKTCSAITLPMLQRYFELTPEQAEELMQQLEDNKIVAPFDGVHPRKILIDHDTRLTNAYWGQARRYETEKPLFDQIKQAQNQADPNQSTQPKVRGCTCSLPSLGIIFFILLLTILLVQLFR